MKKWQIVTDDRALKFLVTIVAVGRTHFLVWGRRAVVRSHRNNAAISGICILITLLWTQNFLLAYFSEFKNICELFFLTVTYSHSLKQQDNRTLFRYRWAVLREAYYSEWFGVTLDSQHLTLRTLKNWDAGIRTRVLSWEQFEVKYWNVKLVKSIRKLSSTK